MTAAEILRQMQEMGERRAKLLAELDAISRTENTLRHQLMQQVYEPAPTTSHGPRVVPLKDAAEALGLKVWAARDQIRKGTFPLPVHQVGRRHVVARYDLDQMLHRSSV